MPPAHSCTETGRLAVLEAQMKELLGNGQPGRMDKAEAKVETHSRLLWLGMGGLWLLQILAANGWLKFHA